VNFDILTIPPFEKDLKKLVKKYPSLKDEFLKLVKSLESNPIQGTALGRDCYKIRLAIKSKQQGKSGGARVITCVKVIDQTVFLLSIYDKSELSNISDKELLHLVNQIPLV
jgi:hypothetical protein